MKKIIIFTIFILVLNYNANSQSIHRIVASTLLGGNDHDDIICSAIDSAGYVYVAGNTLSSDFPVTSNAYQMPGTIYSFTDDIFICKFDSTLQYLISSTRIGGNKSDRVTDILIYDSTLIIAGTSYSDDLPTTPGAYDTTLDSKNDAFILKMDLNLEEIMASTFYGSNGSESARSLGVDHSGNIFITGNTYSTNLPVSADAWDKNYNEGTDAFIAKFSNNLSTLLASTYLGGTGFEMMNRITFDSINNIIVAGVSSSSDYPVTRNALYSSQLGGEYDIILSKLDNNLTTLLSSTYFGGNKNESVNSLFVSQNGNVFLAGATYSDKFIVTPNALNTTHNGSSDIYISKFNSDMDTLYASTFLGGTEQDGNADIAFVNSVSLKISTTNELFAVGYTESNNFPGNPHSAESHYKGWGDIFITKLNENMDTIFYSYVYGGTGVDYIASLCLDESNNLFLSGDTWSSDYPVTQNAYDTIFFGNVSDAFITKFNMDSINGLSVKSLIDNHFKIFPNSTSNYIFIQSTEVIKGIKVFNMNGHIIKQIKTGFENAIDLSDLNRGIYIVEISTLSGDSRKQIMKY